MKRKRVTPKGRVRRWAKTPRGKQKYPVFKVLAHNGKAPFADWRGWSLPRGKRPGAWVECQQPQNPLFLCSNGLHLTHRPNSWVRRFGYGSPKRIFLAEYEVPKGKMPTEWGAGWMTPKFCVYRARLLREVSYDEATRIMRKAGVRGAYFT